jgi:hypothetical protein
VRTNVKKDFLVTNGMKSCQSSSWKVTLNIYNSRFQVQQPFPEIVEYFSNRYSSKRFTQIGNHLEKNNGFEGHTIQKLTKRINRC